MMSSVFDPLSIVSSDISPMQPLKEDHFFVVSVISLQEAIVQDIIATNGLKY